MDEQKLATWLLTVTSDDPDRVEGTTLPTSTCPPVPRLRVAVLRENWTSTEETHKQTCPYCQRTTAAVEISAWHPTLAELFGHGRTRQEEVGYHLERDDCKYCHRLRAALDGNRVLKRLTGERLEHFLRTGIAGKLVEVEGGKDTRLVQVVAAGEEKFVLLRAGEKACFSGPVVTVFDVPAGVLAAEDMPALRAAGQDKPAVWNEWAARALRGGELEGKVREELGRVMGRVR